MSYTVSIFLDAFVSLLLCTEIFIVCHGFGKDPWTILQKCLQGAEIFSSEFA